MITRIEIDGFKTFRNFKLNLAPFQVIVGANGVGKSNLFDALRLLYQLADKDLRTAFQDLHFCQRCDDYVSRFKFNESLNIVNRNGIE